VPNLLAQPELLLHTGKIINIQMRDCFIMLNGDYSKLFHLVFPRMATLSMAALTSASDAVKYNALLASYQRTIRTPPGCLEQINQSVN